MQLFRSCNLTETLYYITLVTCIAVQFNFDICLPVNSNFPLCHVPCLPFAPQLKTLASPMEPPPFSPVAR